MKQAWTRLVKNLRNRGIPDKMFDQAFESAFLKHHNNASELICNKEGKVLAAVYFTPVGMHQEETKRFFKYLRERIQYADEFEEGAN